MVNINVLFVVLVYLTIINTARSCEISQDVCIMFDESSHMGYDAYMTMVGAVVDKLSIISKQSRRYTPKFSAVGYTTTVRTLVHPTAQMSQFERGTQAISLELGETSHIVGLKACHTELMRYNDKNSKTILLISDGKDTTVKETEQYAEYLKKEGVVIASIAVGSDGVDENVLKAIATNADWAFSFLNEFNDFTDSDVVYNALCQANEYHIGNGKLPENESPEKEDEDEVMKFSLNKSTIENGNLLAKFFLLYRMKHFPRLFEGTEVEKEVVTGIRSRGLQNVGHGTCLKGRRTICGIQLRITTKMITRTKGIVQTMRKIVDSKTNFGYLKVFDSEGITVTKVTSYKFLVLVPFNPHYLSLVV